MGFGSLLFMVNFRDREQMNYMTSPRTKRGEAKELANGESFGLNKNTRRSKGTKSKRTRKTRTQ